MDLPTHAPLTPVADAVGRAAPWLQGLTVLVLGLGDSGLAMARWCDRHGAAVTVWDSRDQPPQAAALALAVPAAQRLGGTLDAACLVDFKLVLKSPGLAPTDPRVAPLLAAARERGLAVLGELDLFVRALAELKTGQGYAPQLLAVTGTNGKTTTAAMTAQLVQRTGRHVALAGNIGPTLLDTLSGWLDTPAPVIEEVEAQAVQGAQAMVAGVPERVAVDDDVGTGAEPDLAADVEADAETGTDADADADAAPESVPGADADLPAAAAGAAAPAPVPPPHWPQVWVLELSSFQLDGVSGFDPAAAVVLNLSQDHLDWHGDMDAYAAAKAQVYGPSSVMVVNRDDTRVEAMVPEVVIPKGRKTPLQPPREVLRFGLAEPRRPGDFGLVTQNGMAWLVRALPADETIKRRKDEEEEIHLQRLMPADALRVRGRHNAANALAALALATAIGCPLAPMLHGLRDYRGEPHRVQPVGSVGGIEAYDDSKGTNVGATVAALDGLGAEIAPGRIVVILGGDGKGQDFSPLAAPVARFVRAVALIGRDAGRIEAALAQTGVAMAHQASLEDATGWAYQQARAGDAVLLSPACASLDMFRNYGHRAEVFVAAVQALANDRGEVLA